MAETPQFACRYFFIRLAPNPIREDCVTIGVALMHQPSGFADVRLNLDPRRVRALGAHFVPDDLQGLEEDLRLRLRSPGSAAYLLELAAETFSHSLRFTAPEVVLTADPARELDALFQLYASNPAAPPRQVSVGVRQLVLRHLRDVFREERVLSHLRRDVVLRSAPDDPDPFRFDFAYAATVGEREADYCIHAVPLETDTESVRALCYVTGQLRHALNAEGRAFDLAAFAETEHFDPAPRPARHRAMLESAGIRVLPLDQAPAEAARIRTHLRL